MAEKPLNPFPIQGYFGPGYIAMEGIVFSPTASEFIRKYDLGSGHPYSGRLNIC